MRRLAAPIAAFVAIAALIGIARHVQRYDPRNVPGTDRMDDLGLRAEDATIVSRAHGRREWALKVARLDLRRRPGAPPDEVRSITFASISDGLLYRNGKAEASFAAGHAVYDSQSAALDLRGSMWLRGRSGDLLKSDRCLWSAGDSFARFPVGVRGVLGGHRLAAPSALYSARDRVIQCPRGASGEFDGRSLQAGGLEWRVEEGIVRFTGTVTGRMKAFDFSADRAELNLKTHILRANKCRLRLRIEDDDLSLG